MNSGLTMNDNLRFRYFEGKPASSENRDLECVIAPLSLILSSHKSSKASIGLSGPRWKSDELLDQFMRRLKSAASANTDDFAPPARSFEVTLSSGGRSCFLYVDPTIRTFDLHSEMLRAFGEPLKTFDSNGNSGVILDVRSLDPNNQDRAIRAFVYLVATASWEPAKFGLRSAAGASRKSNSRKKPRREIMISSGLPLSQVKALVERARELGQANNQVRTLADLPANELNPRIYREKIRQFARENGLEFEFWDRKELTRRKAGAFLAVTRADPDSAGGIARLRYVPRGKKKVRKVLSLVGKGICFDTGGYIVKPLQGMLGMHSDMTGSALALALCGYFARMRADFEVRAYLAIAENLISPTAYKPNEVVIASDGTAIEVVDTDAEGRMVLADTLAFARKDKPDLMIDYATLTGAVMRGLDRRKSGVFSLREDLCRLGVECGEQSGERVWYFPLDPDYRRVLKSRIADILQCADTHHADHIYAATFLSHFAGKETPWIHMDLAASEYKGGLGLISSDTTGFGVLWTDAFVRKVLG